MGSGLAKLVEEPNVTVDDRWNQVVDPGVFRVRWGPRTCLSPHLVEGQRGSNLGEDVVLVPLGMLRKQVGGEPRMPGSGGMGAQTNGGAVEDTRLAYESHPGGCISLMWKMWKYLTSDGSGALWSLERREGNSYMVLLCGGAVGHVDEDVDTIGGGECHGSHIDRCFRDSVETSMCLRGNTRYATDGLPFGVRMKKLCPIMTPRA
ncbi:unnamed protein product [Prunus brigantina]